jgi:hypothetical protein
VSKLKDLKCQFGALCERFQAFFFLAVGERAENREFWTNSAFEAYKL